ncbi:MAG: Transcriptional regulator, PaaX family [Candidatus Moranbacteria bacterium GW2011_GWF2_34_56]|nr:MAG: Transcriptional regulator, PaaX family [Candidatus Moranbacteria bacterium GW2011_GWF1_34_10]KKP65409.1 MAG: Transcriptional regulator, PaaX family [Candidatus Moranbacteria bacterium GW2011_GWF2_34_56]HBI16617.1 hypothetical protein [Candidatus Moranbacteria bacterium]
MSIIKRDTRDKILLLLLAGVALGLSTSPRAQRRVFRNLSYDWGEINRKNLYRNIESLSNDGVVKYKKDNEWWNIELTVKGEREAKKIKLNEIKINKPEKWDKDWHLVIFDIPEKKRVARDALRKKMKQIGLIEIQKSTFIYPYSCKKEIDKIAKFFEVDKFVLQLKVINIDKSIESNLIKRFKL